MSPQKPFLSGISRSAEKSRWIMRIMILVHCSPQRKLRSYPRTNPPVGPGRPSPTRADGTTTQQLGPGIHFQLSRVKFPATVSFSFPLADHQISGNFQGNIRFFPSQRHLRREKIRINNNKIRNSSGLIQILVATHF